MKQTKAGFELNVEDILMFSTAAAKQLDVNMFTALMATTIEHHAKLHHINKLDILESIAGAYMANDLLRDRLGVDDVADELYNGSLTEEEFKHTLTDILDEFATGGEDD